jgi:biopolymer transport protein ExbD
MAIPPRRWVGYTLLVVGLALLFDTYTFLRTGWSPLHVPMIAPRELALGYLLAAAGVLTLFAPLLYRSADPCAPDASMRMGESLAHESVELRRQRRLPLRRRFTVLPDRGLVGGAAILLLLLPVFVMVTEHELSRGIYVRLVPRHQSGPNENCIEGPIVVDVKQSGTVSRLFLDGTQVDREHLEQELKSKLAGRADWDVFIEGDDAVLFADPMSAIDAINALHARAVILTPKLKEQMAKACPSR